MEQDKNKKLIERFEKKKKPDKKRVSIYVSEKTWGEVEKVAKKYDTPVSDASEELMQEGLKQLDIQENEEDAS